MSRVLLLCGLVSVIIISLVVALVAIEARPALTALGIAAFFSDPSWHPTSGMFDLTPMLFGTVLVSAGALLLAVPLGFATAVFCHFYSSGVIAQSYRRILQLAAGIPSVVYGLWGIVVLVPMINNVRPPGASLLAGCIILSMMVLPTIAVLADSSIGQVPTSLVRAGAALGAPRHRIVLRVVLPAARAGLLTSVVLAFGRAVGETMAVMMVTGNVVQFPTSVFDPVRTLSSNIALEMAYAMDLHRSALFVSGLVLALLVVLCILLAGLVQSDSRVL